MATQIKPDTKLTNLSMAHFLDAKQYVAKSVFPVVPVALQAGSFYEFNRGDIARDNVAPKPEFGHVAPAVFGKAEQTYNCRVDQVMIGLDQIAQTNYERLKLPGMIDPRRAKTKLATDQLLLHTDILFAQKFFKTGVWGRDFEGKATVSDSSKETLKWDDGNFDPLKFFAEVSTSVAETSRRRPNVLALDPYAYNALLQNPDLIERIKYTGTTANPAVVTKEAIAAILQLDKVVVFESTYNPGKIGQEDLSFIAPEGTALLAYATNAPSIDEPSAGYIFSWDPTGNGNAVTISVGEGAFGTHSEFIEGLMAYDVKVTASDLGVYMHSLVTA